MYKNQLEEAVFSIWEAYMLELSSIRKDVITLFANKTEYLRDITGELRKPIGKQDEAYERFSLKIKQGAYSMDHTVLNNVEALPAFFCAEDYSLGTDMVGPEEKIRLLNARDTLIKALSHLELTRVREICNDYPKWADGRRKQYAEIKEQCNTDSTMHGISLAPMSELPSHAEFQDIERTLSLIVGETPSYSMTDSGEMVSHYDRGAVSGRIWEEFEALNWPSFFYNAYEVSFYEFKTYVADKAKRREEYWGTSGNFLEFLEVSGEYWVNAYKKEVEEEDDFIDPIVSPDFLPKVGRIEILNRFDVRPILKEFDRLLKKVYGVDFKVSDKFISISMEIH